MTTRSIQSVFNIVLNNDYLVKSRSPYMCHALAAAHGDGVITSREYTLARNAIKRYLTCTSTLISGLLNIARSDLEVEMDHMKVNSDYEALCQHRIHVGQTVYGNWDARPRTPDAARKFIATILSTV